MIGGTVGIGILYLLTNLVYLRALPLADISASPRIGESAATALLGAGAGRLMAAAVLISVLGCLSSNILTASRDSPRCRSPAPTPVPPSCGVA